MNGKFKIKTPSPFRHSAFVIRHLTNVNFIHLKTAINQLLSAVPKIIYLCPLINTIKFLFHFERVSVGKS